MTHEEIKKLEIGSFINHAMKKQKINMSELERRSGVSRTIIYKIIKGGQYQIDGLIKIMKHLNINLDMSLKDPNTNELPKQKFN